jgi:hypothetical protein
MHSDLKIVDPIWTTAYITRNHGYMIYDTLLATDANGRIQPQMLDRYTVSPDGLVYTMTLRDGLLWHDGAPVTAEDCVASIKRWGAKDATGQKLMTFVKDLQVVDAKTFRVNLSTPTGLVLSGLGKPSSAAPFMMPKRVAETDPNTQITDFTGSGPFVFRKDEWKPGDKAVYVKFDKYKPRAEPPSGMAGGKVVKVDRVEWRVIADQQTAVNALIAGEIDFIEQPAHDLLPVMTRDANLKVLDTNPLGNQYSFRFNSSAKPFDNPKVKQALLYAFNQEDFLKAVIGDPKYYKTCKAMFICGTPLETTKGTEGLLESNFVKARELLQEAGLRRHADRADALDRPAGADQPRTGREEPDGARRLQGRHAVDGLAERRRAPLEEGPADAGRLARVPDLVGVGRRAEPGDDGVPELELRQGAVRLAVRRPRWRSCATSSRARPTRQAEGDRRAGAVALGAEPEPHLPRPVVPAGRDAQERERRRHRAGHRLLERDEGVAMLVGRASARRSSSD